MLEKELEAKLVKGVEQLGGLCLKWVCPGNSGVPDRIVLLPGGHVLFVELKRPGKNGLDPLQKVWKRTLSRKGFRVGVVNSEDTLRAALEAFEGVVV